MQTLMSVESTQSILLIVMVMVKRVGSDVPIPIQMLVLFPIPN